MAYGTKYICTFDNLRLDIPTIPAFTLEFLFKDYTEATFNIKGGAVVLKHSWDTDDPHATIKGSNLNITIINEAQTLPILSFLSLEDDGVKVRLLWNAQLMFEGFLVQDDCLETLVDFNHEISLTANDNLGLLKNVPFNMAKFQQSYQNFTAEFVTLEGVAPNTLIITALDQPINVGDVISTTGTLSGVYHIIAISGDNYAVSETVTTAAAETVTLIVFRGDFYTFRSLLSFIKSCIKETGLELSTNIYANLHETIQDVTVSFLEQTLADPQTFNQGNDKWDDCYIVLEKILKRFNCTCFQAKGEWQIIRWDEMRYYNGGDVPGFGYDIDFANPQRINLAGYTGGTIISILYTVTDAGSGNELITFTWQFTGTGSVSFDIRVSPAGAWSGPITGDSPTSALVVNGTYDVRFRHYGPGYDDIITDIFTVTTTITTPLVFTTGTVSAGNKFSVGIGENMLWESAPDHRIFRPFFFVKETFNYKQPTNLLKNFDLQETGNLIRAYTTGSGTSFRYINEYEVPWWYLVSGTSTGTPPPTYLIRITQDFLYREIDRSLILINTDIVSTPIDAAGDDYFTFSFTVIETLGSIEGPVTIIYEIRLTNGVDTKYLQENGTWKNYRGYNVLWPDNMNTSHSFDLSGQIPFDGLLTIGLSHITNGPGGDFGETEYRDIRLEYIANINKSGKAIGHTHTSIQGGNIKLNEDEEIFVDSSPRNSIAGTLFLTTMTGVLHTRTTQWAMPGQTDKNLGEITTSETLNWRRSPRTIIEGTLFGKAGLPEFVSLLNVLKYNYFPDLNLIWGKLEIDYRNNKMTGTLWEIYKDEETLANYNYVFKYLYAVK